MGPYMQHISFSQTKCTYLDKYLQLGQKNMELHG